MCPKDKIPSQLKQNIVYKWPCPEENYNFPYIEESSRCFENKVKEHNSCVTIVFYIHNNSNNHSWVYIFHSKITDQESNQVAREAIHIRISKPALNHNMGKMHIPEIFTYLVGADRSSKKSDQMVDSDLPQSCIHLTIPRIISEQCDWQIKKPDHNHSLNQNPSLSPSVRNFYLQSSNSFKGAKDVLQDLFIDVHAHLQ